MFKENRMSKTQKIIAIVLGILALASIAATVIIIINANKPDEPEPEPEPTLDCPMENGVVTYEGEQGKTALEILQSICEIETKTTAEGAIITVVAIDGIKASSPDYWAFYLNSQYALNSPNNILTTETDLIKWQLESVGK